MRNESHQSRKSLAKHGAAPHPRHSRPRCFLGGFVLAGMRLAPAPRQDERSIDFIGNLAIGRVVAVSVNGFR